MVFDFIDKVRNKNKLSHRSVFDVVDYDAAGFITPAKLERGLATMLSNSMTAAEVEAAVSGANDVREMNSDLYRLIRWLDIDGNGLVTRSEFVHMWEKLTRTSEVENEEVVGLMNMLQEEIFSDGLTVEQWFSELDVAVGSGSISISELQPCLENINRRRKRKLFPKPPADAAALLRYMDTATRREPSLRQVKDAFRRACNPDAFTQIARANTKFAFDVNTYLKRNDLKAADMFNSWDVLNKGRLTIHEVFHGFSGIVPTLKQQLEARNSSKVTRHIAPQSTLLNPTRASRASVMIRSPTGGKLMDTDSQEADAPRPAPRQKSRRSSVLDYSFQR